MSIHTHAQAQKTVSTGHLAQLTQNVHSSNENESRAALTELASLASNDAARALIDAYRDCHWRDTRINILRALGRNASQRAIEFLLRTASEHFPNSQGDSKDTGVCQESLLALGDTRDPLAASYLLHRLEGSPAYLKAWIINALSRIPDLRAADHLHRLMESDESHEHPQLLRNIVVALSEMKDTTALAKLLQMLKQRLLSQGQSPDATALTLLSATARLSRHSADLQPFERAFEGEMLHQQFFQQCNTQVNFRQQWSLEDYTGKIFFSNSIHHSLPLELNSFPTDDVIEALSIFATDEKHFKRLCMAIGASLHAGLLLERFIVPESLTEEQAETVLQNICLQRHTAIVQFCERISHIHINKLWKRSDAQPLLSAWLKAVVCVTEKPLERIFELMSSDDFKTAHERQRIEVINAFVNCCLLFRSGDTWPKKHLQLLAELCQSETSNTALGRWLRALGEIGLGDFKWNEDLRQRVLKTPDLHGSVYLMLENEEAHQSISLLKALATALNNTPEQVALYLRACATLKSADKDAPSDELLLQAFSSPKGDEQVAALNYLSKHPRAEFLDSILALLPPHGNEPRSLVSAIVAVRSFRSEKAIAPLAQCLHSHSKIVAGRALDALLFMEHPRANEIVIQHLIEHLNNPVICDKVLRSLKITSGAQGALADALEKAILHSSNITLKDDVLDLAARLRFGNTETHPLTPAAGAIRAIDTLLESKIENYTLLADPVKASLRSAELPLNQPELFEGTVDKSSSVVQYCKALDLTLDKEFGQKILFPKMEQQLHIFQNILHQAEIGNDSPNVSLVLKHLRAEHVFDLNSFPTTKMTMIARSILNGRILRERTQVIDGLKAWAVLILMFSGHERLWGATVARKDPMAFPMLAHKLVVLQDLRNPAAHRQTMLAIAPLSEIRKEVFQVFALIKKVFL